MIRTLIRKGWLVGVIVTALVGWGALGALAGASHGSSHMHINASASANPQIQAAENAKEHAIEVEHHDVARIIGDRAQTIQAVRSGSHRVALFDESRAQRIADTSIVLDQRDHWHRVSLWPRPHVIDALAFSTIATLRKI